DPLTETFNTTSDMTCGPFSGFAGKFSFSARLMNKIGSPSLSNLVVQVTDLGPGFSFVENADGEPDAAITQLTVPRQGLFSDGILGPGEFVDVPFIICLGSTERFNLSVDVFGRR